MRLAALMHRTVAELRETMDAAEWSKWLLFHSLFDLPDGFHVAAQLGTLISQVVSGKGKPENFSPYFKVDVQQESPRRAGTSDLKSFYGFLTGYAKERAAEGRPIPKSRR